MKRYLLRILLGLSLPFTGVAFAPVDSYSLERRYSSSSKFLKLAHPPFFSRSTARWAFSEEEDAASLPESKWSSRITANPVRSVYFSFIMVFCGAALGPFLDSYHSAFGVLEYEEPLSLKLWGTVQQPALTTAWWVPPLFGLAGFLIGWLYVLLDDVTQTEEKKQSPSAPLVFVGISLFTLQYWTSGVMYSMGVDRTLMLGILSVVAAAGFTLDATLAGFVTSLATAVGGPLIEVGLLLTLTGHGGYQYMDKGETGFFPLWIVPVYFLGGPAVGNLARCVWQQLGFAEENDPANDRPRCQTCNDTRAVPCPNCEGQGYYVTYGRQVQCNCCKGQGLVICRDCFANYDEDPNDIEAIRELMSRMPD